jgi:hypothetical protein
MPYVLSKVMPHKQPAGLQQLVLAAVGTFDIAALCDAGERLSAFNCCHVTYGLNVLGAVGTFAIVAMCDAGERLLA